MFNRSQVQALTLLHTLLGGIILAFLLIIQEPIAERVFIPVIAIYSEVKIYQHIRKQGRDERHT